MGVVGLKRILIFLIIGGLLSACTSTLQTQATGILRGHVTIGPLVPVLREGELEPTPAPEVYAARQIVIYKSDGKTEVVRAEIDAQGNYEVSLPVGVYVVDINRGGIDSASGLPKEVEIKKGEVTVLDVDIDTGIR
jgi:hypothetical protein